MKKTLRALAVLLTVVLLASTLCGCNALDEMRARHALLDENGDLTLNGEVYKPLPPCDTFAPIYSFMPDDRLNVTAADVPLLLSSLLAEEYFCLCTDDAFLWDADNEVYYCKADRYTEICRRINEGPVLSAYGYEYRRWDQKSLSYLAEIRRLSDAEADALEQVVLDVQPAMINQQTIELEYLMDFCRYSEDLLFKEPFYTLVLHKDVYFLYLEVDADTAALYRVPDSLSGVFADIVRDYLDAGGDADIVYTDDFTYVYDETV